VGGSFVRGDLGFNSSVAATMNGSNLVLNVRLFFRRHPRLLVAPFVFLLVIGLTDSLFGGAGVGSSRAKYVRYMHQQAYLQYHEMSTYYNISVISDRDKASKSSSAVHWEAFVKNGVLTRGSSGLYNVEWSDEIIVKSKYNEENRGMELSELAYYNGQLFSCDDRTGIVYEIYEGQAIPHYILMDGDGHSTKGFKCEWMTVKDDLLYVGGLGKEWTNEKGEVIGRAPQFVKTIDLEGRIAHISWVHVYEALRVATGTSFPGYLIHEAVRFHPVQRRWYFLPRRVSTEPYVDTLDESRGSNVVISTDEIFKDIRISHLGEKIPTHGFSSFAFVPYREHEVVALKTEEVESTIATYIAVFDLDGTILMPETQIGVVKYEGIEII